MPSTLTMAPGPPLASRRARVAVNILFFTNGALIANLLPRYPQIKNDLGLTNASFGAAVAAFPLGALLAGLTTGLLIRRFRSSRVAVAATLVTAVGLLLAGFATSWAILALTLLIAGAMDSITDVAQNSHGLRVQRLFGRSIINSFHAVWSVGAVTGGVMGAAAAALSVPLVTHLTISAVLLGAAAIASYRWLLPGPEPEGEPPITGSREGASADVGGADVRVRQRRLSRILRCGVILALVVIASSGAVVEDAGSSWSAIYLTGNLGASAFVAGLGFIALQSMQFVGRIFADRMVDRFGQRAVARAGGIIVFLGMGAALAFPTAPGTIIGFGLAGFGVASLIPAAMHTADTLPGLRPGTGLTIVSWLLRVGFLVSPPVVGAIADASSLRFGLLVVPAAGLLVLLFSSVLATHRPQKGATP